MLITLNILYTKYLALTDYRSLSLFVGHHRLLQSRRYGLPRFNFFSLFRKQAVSLDGCLFCRGCTGLYVEFRQLQISKDTIWPSSLSIIFIQRDNQGENSLREPHFRITIATEHPTPLSLFSVKLIITLNTMKVKGPSSPATKKGRRSSRTKAMEQMDVIGSRVEALTPGATTNVSSSAEQEAIARGGVATPFPWKLHEMLEDATKEGNEHIVSWQPHGYSFIVHKPKVRF